MLGCSSVCQSVQQLVSWDARSTHGPVSRSHRSMTESSWRRPRARNADSQDAERQTHNAQKQKLHPGIAEDARLTGYVTATYTLRAWHPLLTRHGSSLGLTACHQKCLRSVCDMPFSPAMICISSFTNRGAVLCSGYRNALAASGRNRSRHTGSSSAI